MEERFVRKQEYLKSNFNILVESLKHFGIEVRIEDEELCFYNDGSKLNYKVADESYLSTLVYQSETARVRFKVETLPIGETLTSLWVYKLKKTNHAGLDVDRVATIKFKRQNHENLKKVTSLEIIDHENEISVDELKELKEELLELSSETVSLMPQKQSRTDNNVVKRKVI